MKTKAPISGKAGITRRKYYFGLRHHRPSTVPHKKQRYYLLDGDEMKKLERILDECGLVG